MTASPAPFIVAASDGRRSIGSLRIDGAKIEALDLAGKPVGTFGDRVAALKALAALANAAPAVEVERRQ